ncbi:hypothetical protein LCGC14_0945280 [marine sediment metagenome]|uniref:4Fe-4S ferredoxin-type domain-containing protein n=1 Tax=marine sediment metagenome TaxID=412755 RepID=A0A0F9P4Z9_9ZZZZ
MNKNDGSILSVIKNGYCIGCGACTYVNKSLFNVKLNKYGMYSAIIVRKRIDEEIIKEASKICPFSDFSLNEFEISRNNEESLQYDDKIGFYINLYVGHISNLERRIQSSSGGLITWFLSYLLKNRQVDGVIHINPCYTPGTLFKYSISENVNHIRNGSGSHYYPIDLSKILNFLKESSDKKYVIVGLPCFIKSIKLLSLYYPEIRSKIKYHIGLVCGHLKATSFSELICLQCNINPMKVLSMKYRYKFKNRKASQYGLKILYMKKDNLKKKIVGNNSLFGMKWSYGFFKYPACDFCDDVYCECADISFGDAWLSEYEIDCKGTNIIIPRNKEIDDILINASKNKEIEIKNISKLEILKSQAGGIRHKRDGMQYRLYLYKKKLIWAPKKRYEANNEHISIFRRLLYKYRFYISISSNKLYFKSKKRKYPVFYFRIHITGLVIMYNLIFFTDAIVGKIRNFLRR